MSEDRNQVKNAGTFWIIPCTFLALVWIVLVTDIADTRAQQSDSSSEKIQGTVTGNQVNVRGGPGRKYKSIGKVDSGTSLTVLGKEGDWYEVVPPEGTSVWIFGAYVNKLSGQPSTGKVTGDDVNVRPLPRADRSNSPIGQVSSPAEVKILEEMKVSGYDDPWYRIPVPNDLTGWIHSDYVRTGNQSTSSGDSTDRSGVGSNGETKTSGSSPRKGSSESGNQEAGESEKAEPAPRKGNESPQKGEVPRKGTPSQPSENGSVEDPSTRDDRQKWVSRLDEIRESIRNEKQKDKLDWDFTDEIRSLQNYQSNCPVSDLKTRASEIQKQLEQAQSRIRQEVSNLNKTLAEIREARRRSVRQSLQAVMEAKGFKWKKSGTVRSVGPVIGRPAKYQLEKGGSRICFLIADVYDLSNFRGREVAISGEVVEKPEGWDVPVFKIKTMKIME